MRYRQVHLDFHTSPLVEGVGSKFDADDFADTFARAKVNAVNLFSKCHHGYSYHPTKVGEMHPHLDFNLLRSQMDALKKKHILTPVYVSAIWDERSARQHPEWRVVSPDFMRPVHHARGNQYEGAWKFLDLSSPYADYLYAQIEEVTATFPDLDGVWIDICFQKPSVSVWAQDGMEAQGLDWTDPEHRDRFAEDVSMRFFERVNGIAKKAGAPVFFNLGHVRRGRAEVLRHYFSHIEIESLPTGQWGYEHFPVSARYAETLGMDYLGMTGKFHHMWGEMGGYKKPEALVYESGATLAQGARVCIGDHLHPSGRIDPSTYAAIGGAFAHVEAREPWCEGSVNRAEIGILSTEALRRPKFSDVPGHHNPVDDGAVRLLLESEFTFDLLDAEADFSNYRLLILPDEIEIDSPLKNRIDAYLAQGGRLLLSGASGISEDGMLYPAGCVHHGRAPFSQGDFALPVENLRADFVDEPLFMYAPSERLRLDRGESLGEIHDPYFDRIRDKFSGHLHSSNRLDPNGYAFGASDGAVTRLAHPVFSIYHRVGAVAMLEIVSRVIDKALGRARMIRTSLPMAGRATLRRQNGRDVLHLLHANPALRGNLRGAPVQIIQDIVPLYDVACDIEADHVDEIRVVPEGGSLKFESENGRVRFNLPELHGHAMVEILTRG